MTERETAATEAGHEAAQRAHYDEIADEYERHYGDEWSLRYRSRFINAPLLRGIDLRGKQVLEALCGGGTVTRDLLDRGAVVTGLDISPKMMEVFAERWPGCRAVTGSIFATEFADASFDAVVIVGGLHHLHPDVQKAVDEIARILKPGGFLCFMEPHAGSVPDLFRRLWYRFDRFFEDNEAAVDVDGLARRNAAHFTPVRTKYAGNVAFLLVFNSLVFRIPLRLKRYYSPALFAAESAIGAVQGKRLSIFALSQWRKK